MSTVTLVGISLNFDAKDNVSLHFSDGMVRAKATATTSESLQVLLENPTAFFKKHAPELNLQVEGKAKSIKIKGKMEDSDKIATTIKTYAGKALKSLVFKKCKGVNAEVFKRLAAENNLKLKLREEKEDQEMTK